VIADPVHRAPDGSAVRPQDAPFQVAANEPRPEVPTAVQAMFEVQDTPYSTPGWPRAKVFQLWPFHREQLTGDGTDMFLISGIDLVTPLARLTVQILPTAEGTPARKFVSMNQTDVELTG